MVDLASGSRVRTRSPNVTIRTSMPGLVNNVWLKEGPTGPAGAAGTGDVNGPASSVADRVAVFNGTTGKLIKDGGATIAGLQSAASTSAQGIVELATSAETQTGTDTARAVTPAGFRAGGDDRYAQSTGGGREKKATASATTGSTTLDCSAASLFSVTPTGNITAVSLTNVPASPAGCTITFIVNQGATPRTIATPTGGVFLGAPTPTQVANKTCVFTYLTVDGGTTWYCSAAVQV